MELSDFERLLPELERHSQQRKLLVVRTKQPVSGNPEPELAMPMTCLIAA